MIKNKKFKEFLLKKSEQSTKLLGFDLPYFFKGASWLLISHSSFFVKGFLLSVLFANLLSKEVYGQYTFTLSMLAFAGAFALPGLKSALTQAISRNKDGEYSRSLHRVFRWSLLGSSFLLLVAIYGYIVGREYGMYIFIFLALIFPFYSSSQYFKPFFTGKEKYRQLSLLSSASNLITALFIALSLIFDLNLFWVIFSSIFTQTLVEGYISFFIAPKYLKNSKIDSKTYEYGKNLSYVQGFAMAFNQSITILITLFLGFEALAIFTILSVIPNQFKSLFGALSPMFIPKLSRQEIEARDLFKQVLKVFALSFVFFLIYVISSPILFYLFYEPYKEYLFLSILFATSILFILPYMLLEEYFKAKLRNEIKYLYTIPPLLNIIILLLLLPLGLLGVVLSRILYRFSLILMALYFLFREKQSKE
jgi:O-antigen/teichoic acid export membrane protein